MSKPSDGFAAMNADVNASTGGEAGDPTVPCHAAKRRVWIAVKDPLFQLVTGTLYELKAGGETFSGRIPAEGVITHVLTGSTGTLRVWNRGGLETKPVEWKLDIGGLDPATLASGAEQRLTNLDADDDSDDDVPGLAALQELFGATDQDGNAVLSSVYSTETKYVLPDEAWRPEAEDE